MMSNPDLDKPRWASLGYAAATIQDGWIGQFQGDSWVSRMIQYGTQGPHSHSMMFRRNNGTVDVLEVREWYGGRAVPLDQLRQQQGRVDVFSTCRDGIYKNVFDADGAVEVMRRLTQHSYGWRGLFSVAIRRTPLLWRMYPIETSDVLPKNGDTAKSQPFCSHAVALATHEGGGVDPVPNCPHHLVTPNHLTWSLFYRYEFSLLTPWAVRTYGPEVAEGILE